MSECTVYDDTMSGHGPPSIGETRLSQHYVASQETLRQGEPIDTSLTPNRRLDGDYLRGSGMCSPTDFMRQTTLTVHLVFKKLEPMKTPAVLFLLFMILSSLSVLLVP